MTAAVDLASGKGARDENFPVASFLLKPEHRVPVMAFYRFARAADDIADHPTASADEKLRLLNAMRAGLRGGAGEAGEGTALGEVMAARGLDPVHAFELIDAFEQDVTVRRYATWDDLIGYCRLSAMPVGRFVLDVHGEDRTCWPASDALCAALQVINHLQDCGEDYRTLDRVYIPGETFAETGSRPEDLAAAAASPALGAAIKLLARRTFTLLDQSAPFASMIRDGRLSAEVAIIQRLATSLTHRLVRRDPLSQRVHHTAPQAALLSLSAVIAHMLRRKHP
jgi:squalene synthase HpnC